MSIHSFSVENVQRTDPPEGADRGTWYSYVVSNEKSRITGCRRGSRDQVRKYAESFAEVLNDRARRGYSVWAPTRRK
jgi:hypothetical protein